MAKKSLRMSSYTEKKRKLQEEEEEKAKAVVSVIVQFQTADVVLRVLFRVRESVRVLKLISRVTLHLPSWKSY